MSVSNGQWGGSIERGKVERIVEREQERMMNHGRIQKEQKNPAWVEGTGSLVTRRQQGGVSGDN